MTIKCSCTHGMQQHSWRNWRYMHCLMCGTCGKGDNDHVFQHHQWKRCDCIEYVAAQQVDFSELKRITGK